METCFEILLSNLPPGFSEGSSLEEKFSHYTSLIDHKRKDIRLGAVTGAYLLLKYNEVRIDLLMTFVQKLFSALMSNISYHDTMERAFVVVCLEMLIFIGPTEVSYQ